MVINLAWQTRQRRLQTKAEGKSKIPPVVGAEHNRLGNWLTSAVVGIALLGLAHPITKNILTNELVTKEPFQVAFIGLMFVATISCPCLSRARILANNSSMLKGLTK